MNVVEGFSEFMSLTMLTLTSPKLPKSSNLPVFDQIRVDDLAEPNSELDILTPLATASISVLRAFPIV
jgi:hypothetical protein